MTEESPPPPLDVSPEPVVMAPKPPRRDLVPWFYGLGFLILAAAILFLWQYPSEPNEAAVNAAAVHSVEQHLADVDGRLNQLEQRPAGASPAQLSKLAAQVDALEGRLGGQTQAASRLDALSGRIESLSGRIESVSGRDHTDADAMKQQMNALASRVTALESSAGNLDAVSQKISRVAKLQEAAFALAAGRPIGDLPNAPEALSRYAHAAPPTEAQLRLSFPNAERAALAADQPDAANLPPVDRFLERAEGLVTIRRGDDVVVGNSSATVLNQAQVALAAGDLAGAVHAVATLKGQPEQAMASWLVEARALLGARSALADMAGQA